MTVPRISEAAIVAPTIANANDQITQAAIISAVNETALSLRVSQFVIITASYEVPFLKRITPVQISANVFAGTPFYHMPKGMTV